MCDCLVCDSYRNKKKPTGLYYFYSNHGAENFSHTLVCHLLLGEVAIMFPKCTYQKSSTLDVEGTHSGLNASGARSYVSIIQRHGMSVAFHLHLFFFAFSFLPYYYRVLNLVILAENWRWLMLSWAAATGRAMTRRGVRALTPRTPRTVTLHKGTLQMRL